jgi:hypothetical protein
MSAGCGSLLSFIQRDAGLAVGVDRAAADLAQRTDRLVGVARRILDVRPVEERGHAGVERGEAPEQRGGIDVLRPEARPETLEQLHEHARQVPIDAGVTDRALPGVAVRIDEAGEDEVLGDVDRFDVAAVDPARDLLDFAVDDEHIAGEFAEPVIDRDNEPATQDKTASAWCRYRLLRRHCVPCVCVFCVHEPR